MGKERRKQERLDAHLFVEFENKSEESRGRGVVVDVSLSGFAVDTQADLEHGETLGCHIEIPIYLKARVMRTLVEGQMKRYGLRFEGQSFLDKIVLKKLLRGKRRTRKV